MFAGTTVSTRCSILAASVAAALFGLVLLAGGFGQSLPSAQAQDKAVPTAWAILGPAAFVPIAEQPRRRSSLIPRCRTNWRRGLW